jgi:hypothetical protein
MAPTTRSLATLSRLSCLLVVLLGLVLMIPASVAAQGQSSAKVQVCHRPPGNPANYHTITISANALASHLAHGDLPGACEDQCEALCNDGNACTVDAGTFDPATKRCVCSPTPVDCDDSNTCTADSCNPATGCVNTPVAGLACDDGNTCTTAEACNAEGQCGGGTQVPGCCVTDNQCDQSNQCAPQACEGNTCVTQPVVCPGDACSVAACDPATGCTSVPRDCNDANPCTTDSCNPVTGCVNTPIANGTSCGDGNVCNGAETCQEGACVAGPPPNCNDNNACTVDSCDPAVGCTFTAANCDDSNACTADSCEPASGCTQTPVSCDDGNQCTADTCDPSTGCQSDAVPDFTPCDDGNPNTFSDRCFSGVCQGVMCFEEGRSCNRNTQCCSGICTVDTRRCE